jgi:hypothetical protein
MAHGTGGEMPDAYRVELENALPDKTDQERFANLVDLLRLLGDCIIANNYSVPSELTNAIRLTVAGQALMNKVALTPKADRRIPPNEARLMCALAVGERELFVDVQKTNITEFANSISHQIETGKIRLPFSFGREAYDAFATQHEEGDALLSYEETQRLLDALPNGVQQYGQYVTGPFGLQVSADSRMIRSVRRLPAYHCADPMCDIVHQTLLETSKEALINKHRPRFEEELDDEDPLNIDWFQAVDELHDMDAILFSDAAVGVSAMLLGDALSLVELKALTAHLLDSTHGELRQLVAGFLEVTVAKDAVAELNRAELMQIVLLARERSIQSSVDQLVDDETIKVPRGEIRRPVVNIGRRSGAFSLTPELSHLGIRFVSDDPGFAMLRLRAELARLHESDDDGREELNWQLRDIPGESIDERLDSFFRDSDPADCIERLALARKGLLDRLAERLQIEQGLGDSNSDIADRVLWKLGFERYESEDPRAQFWDLHGRLVGLVKVSRSPASRDTEEYLGVASKYFRELERFLAESLSFAAWSMLHDHSTDSSPFEYGLESDQRDGMALVQEAFEALEDSTSEFDFTGQRLELYALIRGFGILGKYLKTLDLKASIRPESELPAYTRASQLKKFPFHHTVPYLDLTPASREKLIVNLEEISKSLQRNRVSDFRNAHQHYRKTATGVKQIESALAGIEACARMIEDLGFGLIEFKLEDEIHDRWGRSEYFYAAPRGSRHAITRPSNFDWLHLPELRNTQYVVSVAAFADPGEVLRFRRRFDSAYSELWRNYPTRRRSQGSALNQTPAEHQGAEIRQS